MSIWEYFVVYILMNIVTALLIHCVENPPVTGLEDTEGVNENVMEDVMVEVEDIIWAHKNIFETYRQSFTIIIPSWGEPLVIEHLDVMGEEDYIYIYYVKITVPQNHLSLVTSSESTCHVIVPNKQNVRRQWRMVIRCVAKSYEMV